MQRRNSRSQDASNKPAQFQCQQCGNCCKRMILEIWGLDVLREPKLVQYAKLCNGQEDECEAYKVWTLPTPCPLLVDNKCSIYETRPTMCVAFGYGESGCGDSDAERCAEMRRN